MASKQKNRYVTVSDVLEATAWAAVAYVLTFYLR